ncbi:MAG: hypothetical protein AAB632_01950 [Patescibacteria group bacterium]
MANTQAQKQNKIKNLVKFLVAIMVLILLWAFFNDSTYNIVKKEFVKNADKYTEMYAYTKSKPAFNEKYFIVQENKQAESFFRKEVKAIDEGDIDNISCSKDEIIILYEKPSQKISEYIQKKEGEALVLNKGTDIEFYAAKVKGSTESCSLGE